MSEERRTQLAVERTYLAWWRTGLTSLAVAVGVGRIAPDVSNGARWPYELVGAGFAAVGVLLLWIGYSRTRADRYEHGAHPRARQCNDHELDAVAHVQRDSVAGAHTALYKTRGAFGRRVVQLDEPVRRHRRA